MMDEDYCMNLLWDLKKRSVSGLIDVYFSAARMTGTMAAEIKARAKKVRHNLILKSQI
jgi:hypothetical protein